jgi:chromosome segregation ATPase
MAETTDITLDVLRNIQDGISGLREDVRENSKRLGGVEQRLGGVEQRLGGVEQRLEEHGRILEAHGRKLDAHGRRLGALETRMHGVETRVHELVNVTTLSITRQLDLATRVDVIEERVAALEAR